MVNYPPVRPMRVLTLVLAGGEGKRLLPLTQRRSKPAVSFGGSFRVIDFTLFNCLFSNLRQVFLLTQYQAASLRDHLEVRWNLPPTGLRVDCLQARARPSAVGYHGTADAVRQHLDLLDALRPDAVLVLSGDHIYRADYRRLLAQHLQSAAEATILTGEVEEAEASAFGVVCAEGPGAIRRTLSRFVEKPTEPSLHASGGRCRISLGIYCFRPDFLRSALTDGETRHSAHDFGRDILPPAISAGRVESIPIDEIAIGPRSYWRDVGTVENYFAAQMDLVSPDPLFDLRDPRWPVASIFRRWVPNRSPDPGEGPESSSLLASGVRAVSARLRRCVISAQAQVEAGADLEECLVLPGARVGEGARLRRVIVDEGAEVPADTILEPLGVSVVTHDLMERAAKSS